MANYLSTGTDWTFDLIEKYDHAIANVAKNCYKLDTYPNQIEVITSEQMLDAYSSVGLPIMYPHWSFGKSFIQDAKSYERGTRGLAYEIVINSNPCIAYLMEENSMPMQALVIAHACYGHNSFFKGNYLFRQWTNADSIIDYMVFAKKYIMECERKYGPSKVEELLDICHALQSHGVDKYKHPKQLSVEQEKKRQVERENYEYTRYDEIWTTIPEKPTLSSASSVFNEDDVIEPQENLLYFLEKKAPNLEQWQREIIRIVRKVAQYFYPQGPTKVMNEGWATFWHYTLLNHLYDDGLVNDGLMIEFLKSHTNVIAQPSYKSKYFSGMNPYALGFSMMKDIRRICEKPTAEDYKWFPDYAGQDWLKVLDHAMRNYKDESFVAQFLSPKIMRDMHLFTTSDEKKNENYVVAEIHNEDGYKNLRRHLSEQYKRDAHVPDIQITHFAKKRNRSLWMQYNPVRGRQLSDESKKVTQMFANLWGFEVNLWSRNEMEVVSYEAFHPDKKSGLLTP